jgi:hypothetical protein
MEKDEGKEMNWKNITDQILAPIKISCSYRFDMFDSSRYHGFGASKFLVKKTPFRIPLPCEPQLAKKKLDFGPSSFCPFHPGLMFREYLIIRA